jgi:hypothetical protein
MTLNRKLDPCSHGLIVRSRKLLREGTVPFGIRGFAPTIFRCVS